MRLSGLLYFYGRRLRTRPVQELLAGVGIAIGVALVFAVQVANTSITDASSEIVRGIAGLPAAALAASKACIAAAGHKDRGGYTDELEFTRLLLNDAEARKRVQAFLAGAAEPSTQTKSGAAG